MINDSMADVKEDRASLKLHFFYVTLILSCAIVLLATKNWTTLEGFTDYLNVAATVTSLVLGVLAIIYSFVSSNSINNFLGSVEASAREMRTIGTEMRSIVTSGQDLQGRAEQRNEELHALVNSLRVAVDSVSSKTTKIADAVETLPSRYAEVHEVARKRDQLATTTQQTIALNDLWTPDHHTAFLETASLLGLVAIKGMLEASLMNKYCDLKQLFTTKHSDNFEYVYGFLIASWSAGVLRFEHPAKLSFADGKVRLIAPSAELETAVTDEWARRLQAGDQKKLAYLEECTSRIAAVISDAPVSDA